ncbi:hypothetical protein [Fannyhessea vaginae]|nr:hypothetical protein [Fannyhessea vaginae]
MKHSLHLNHTSSSNPEDSDYAPQLNLLLKAASAAAQSDVGTIVI